MKYFVFFFILSGFLVVPAFAQDSCDINDDAEIRKKLDQDPVVKRFLERHPSAIFTHHKTFDEPGNPYTFSEFSSDGLHLKVLVSEHDDNGNCHYIRGYFTEYDFPNAGIGYSTKTDHFDAVQWKDAIIAVNGLTNPHKQMKMGIPIYEIKCKEGLYPIPKVDRITPACVTDDANSKLIMRGWTPLRIGMPAETNIMISYNATMLHPFKATKDLDPRSPYFSRVYWVNNDIISHTIVAKDGSWKTDEIKPGKIGAMSFNNTGIYNYYVAERPETKGVIMFDHFIDLDLDPNEEYLFPMQIALENIRDKITSSDSVDEWKEEIQKQVDQKNLKPFSAVVLKDMKDTYHEDESISFNLVTFGYIDWCLMPAVTVYHEDYLMPIYEHEIVHTCPAPSGNPLPRISMFDEQDFPTFPTCQFEGTYTIWAQSYEFGPEVVGSFYCHSANSFTPPKTFDVTILPGSSDFDIQSNFSPSEINMVYGDYFRITNLDSKTHNVVLFMDKKDGSAVFAMPIPSGDSFSVPIYNLGTFALSSLNENDKEYLWMNGIITVRKN